jgi:hypothetical protein
MTSHNHQARLGSAILKKENFETVFPRIDFGIIVKGCPYNLEIDYSSSSRNPCFVHRFGDRDMYPLTCACNAFRHSDTK